MRSPGRSAASSSSSKDRSRQPRKPGTPGWSNWAGPTRASPWRWPSRLAATHCCTPETAKDFSAVGYFFGTALLRARNVPVGLIDLGRGGASIRTFLPAAVAGKPEFASAFPEEVRPGYSNGRVFAEELTQLAPFALRGVLWYQGESDAGRANIYAELLGAMIGAWRDTFDSPGLPFLIVQLPAWERRRTDPPKPEPV